MDYLAIVKRTWRIISKRPYFWLAGLLAGGGGFSTSVFSLPMPSDFNYEKLFARASDYEQIAVSVVDFIRFNWPLVLTGIVIISIICLILFILSFAAQAGLVKAVFDLERKSKESNFFKLIGEGFNYFWPVFLISIIVYIATGMIIGVLSLPMFLGIISPLLVIGWGLIFAFILAIVLILAEIIHLILIREVVVGGSSLSQSFSNGWQFIKQNLVQLILAWLVVILAWLVISFVLALAFSLYLVIAGLIFWLAYVLSYYAAVVIGALLLLILIILILTASGFISSFRSSYWTLVYGKIKKVI